MHSRPPDTSRTFDSAALRAFAECDVRVRLLDGNEFAGRLRTDLLSDRSLSVYISAIGGGGATLYLDQIVSIQPC